MKGWFKHGNRIGAFLAVLFVVLFAFYWLRPVNQELRTNFLQLFFYGYSGMNFPSLILGVIQAYVWGYIASAVWQITNFAK